MQLGVVYPEALLYEIWACLGQLGSFEWIYVKGMFSFLVGPSMRVCWQQQLAQQSRRTRYLVGHLQTRTLGLVLSKSELNGNA